jgi:hypothetical protein
MTAQAMPVPNEAAGRRPQPGTRQLRVVAPTAAPVAPAKKRDRTAVGERGRSVAATVRRDARTWWVVTSQSTSLEEWWQSLSVDRERVPDDSTGLRVGWKVDNATTGVGFGLIATALFMIAASVRYLSLTPLRRWSTILITAALALWAVLS